MKLKNVVSRTYWVGLLKQENNKYFLLLIVVLLPYILGNIIASRFAAKSIEKSTRSQLEREAKVTEERFENIIKKVENDFLIFDNVFLSIDDINTLDQFAIENFKNNIDFIVGDEDIYDHYRVVQQDGQEVLRIDSQATEDNKELKNIAQRTYFQRALALNNNQYYISPIELNKEGNPPKIEVPFNPIFRIIKRSNNENYFQIINISVNKLFDDIESNSLATEYNAELLILNENGYFLKHPNPELTFGFEKNQSDLNINNIYPEAWASIENQSTGFIKQIQDDDSDFVLFSQEIYVSEEENSRKLYLLYQIPKASFYQELNQFNRTLLMINALGICFILAGYSILLRLNARLSSEKQYSQALKEEIRKREESEARLIENQDELVKTQDNLKRAIQAISIEKRNAENSAKFKSRFLSSMSHEIRTPINGILGLAELLSMEDLTAKQASFIESILSGGKHLLHLINEILDLSKLEEGKIELNNRLFSLYEAVQNSVQTFWKQAEDKGIQLSFQIDPDLPEYYLGDYFRISQIFLNLISNAVKFTESGKVTVKVARLDEEIESLSEYVNPIALRCEIEDTGIGIAAERQQKLFQEFSQTSKTIAAQYGGTGLGLSICKKLVELMHGDIGVISEQGEGSKFWFTITLDIPNDSEISPSKNTQTIPNVLRNDPNPNIKILVAEDNPLNQRVISYQMEKLGYQFDIVENGVEAIEVLKKNQYKMVLMDCNMPVMDGYEATELIRSTDNNIPIVGFTASVTQEDVYRCLESGMTDYLSKPANLEAVAKMIERWAE